MWEGEGLNSEHFGLAVTLCHSQLTGCGLCEPVYYSIVSTFSMKDFEGLKDFVVRA